MSATNSLLQWLATATIHASVLIALALLADTFLRPRSLVLRETLWRLALVGGLCTASLQALLGTEPVAGRVALPFAVPTVATGSRAVAATSAAPDPAPIRAMPARHRNAAPGSAAVAARDAAGLPEPTVATVLRGNLRAWPSLVVALWLAGLCLAMARLARGAWNLRRTVALMPPLADEQCRDDAAALSRAARIAAPRLRASAGLAGPIAAPGGVVCLPLWALAHLDRRQRLAMLAHEIAHLARRDAWWQLVDALAHAALLFNPLAAMARRRLAAIAELSCDAWAARATGDALALAECLARCVEHALPHPIDYPAPAMAMATSTSPVLARVEHLLSENPMSTLSRKPLVRAFALAGIIGATFVLPAIGVVDQAHARGSSIEIQDSIFGNRIKAHFKDAVEEMRVEGNGDFEFNARETDLAQLEDGAELSIEQTKGGTTRRIEFEGADGSIARRYFIDGDEAAFDAAAQQWLAQAIPGALRRTGVDAEARVGRLLARGGASVVLDEVDLIESAFVRRTYLSELAGQADPDAAQLDRALALAAGIDSDFERREALAALAGEAALGPAQQVHALAAVQGMDSDFEQRSAFEALAPVLSDDDAVAAATLAALDAIGSDFERREAIGYLAARKQLTAAQLATAIKATLGIESDFEHREALAVLARHLRAHVALATPYVASIAAIESDFERREAIVTLVESATLEVADYAAAIEAADGIESDFDSREALVAIAAHMPADAALIERYRKAARGLDDFERGQAEKALDRLATL
ncbi:MAG: M56 family metallopeptidase [Burkholderiales bacterium]|nr:M56 family metallopeptidase [Burkholderiales bacterium]